MDSRFEYSTGASDSQIFWMTGPPFPLKVGTITHDGHSRYIATGREDVYRIDQESIIRMHDSALDSIDSLSET
jgi:hypothetical protein